MSLKASTGAFIPMSDEDTGCCRTGSIADDSAGCCNASNHDGAHIDPSGCESVLAKPITAHECRVATAGAARRAESRISA
jgi:hypothetical protein